MNPYRNQNPTLLPGLDLQSSDPQISVQSAAVLQRFQTSSNQNRAPCSSEPAPGSENPYPTPAPVCQVSVIVPSRCSEDLPDLECSVCFSQFNNIFRCPKILLCGHTFCLECLARINVKSAEPGAVQCPLCRGLTPLPTLGPPKLTTDANVLSCLPAAMQRVYSVRFLRNEGKLQVKRSSGDQRSLASLRSARHSLDVGVPSSAVRAGSGGVGGALFRLTGRPACRAFLLTSVVMMMVLLLGIIIFIFTFRDKQV
ncbi:E3 ubiquitin-protein ligase RNF183 [Sphaeramia orbicularis]|uniref:E3 ubiquitin-protein ligase RNF183-like n=1 Tax=Sphaeramia orbicularis TaxID=375764 RepID=A0A673B3W0_9TELE|nr:E3 ubiquitin-protein ligase RNF183-like [Sphaeramia orbicularis]